MSINLVQAVNAALSDNIAEQLSQQFGIPASIVRQLTARTVPGLVASLMDRATLVPGAQSVYSVIMQPETSAHIVDQFPKLIATTGGLKQLEANGHLLAALAAGQRIDALTDAISAETGVPTQATSALAGVIACVLFGLIKRHFLLAQWNLTHLPGLLREQVAEINATMSNSVAAAIGVGNTEGFTSGIAVRLDAVASSLERRANGDAAVAEAAVAEPVAKPVSTSAAQLATPAAKPAAPPPPAARATTRAPVKRRSNKWIWLLFAVLTVILGMVYYRGFTSAGTVDLGAASPTQPVAKIAPPASETTLPQPQAAEPAASAATASNASAAPAQMASAPAVAPSVTPDSSADAQLRFNVNNAGVPSIEATVGTEAEKTQLLDALSHRFGKALTANVSVVPDTRPAAWLSRMNDFFPLMAVPGAEAKVQGSKVELSGVATDARLGWTDRLKSTLGGTFQVATFDADTAVASASQSFRTAMKSLLATDAPCAGDKLTRVLDLQVVNFTRSSAQVPESAQATLGETAQLLVSCAAKGSTVKLEIAGYSDAQGAKAARLEVSKERAQAVRGFLVRRGVPPQSLTATGYGDVSPVADNETESGRFANRRIEFVVKKG